WGMTALSPSTASMRWYAVCQQTDRVSKPPFSRSGQTENFRFRLLASLLAPDVLDIPAARGYAQITRIGRCHEEIDWCQSDCLSGVWSFLARGEASGPVCGHYLQRAGLPGCGAKPWLLLERALGANEVSPAVSLLLRRVR